MDNIVFVSHHIGGVGGVQAFTERMATAFCADGLNVHVIGICCPGKNKTHKIEAEAPFKSYVLFDYDVFATKPWSLLLDSFIYKSRANKIQELLNELPSYSIIITNPLAFLVLRSVDLSKAKKIVVQFHGSASELLNGYGRYLLYRILVKRYYRHADHFLLLSSSDAQLIANSFQWSHVSFMANPCPVIKRDTELSLSKNVFVVIGRIDKWKQIEHAIKAFEHFSITNPNCVLKIYGDGSEMDKLKRIARKTNYDAQIHFEGHCSELSECFKDAIATLITSRSEGLPFTLLESLAHGVPVLSYNCSKSIEEILKDCSGLLVQSNQPNELAKSMDRIVHDEAWRKELLSELPDMIKQFRIEKIVKSWYQLLSVPIIQD